MTQAANLASFGTNTNSTGTLTASGYAANTIPNYALSQNNTFRNWIVNGGFDVWQRGTPVTGVNTWTADRFFNTNTSMTWTKASNTLGGPCANMCTLTSGDSSSRFRFSFELPSSTNQAPFTVGSYWTLSLYTDFNLTGRTMNVGFADNPNGTTDICSNDATWVSLGGNRWSLTVQINATNSNNRLAMRFSGPFNGPVNHGVSSISITGIQFEAGTVATPFELRPIGVELALCQRYYQRFGGNSTYETYNIGQAYASTYVWCCIPLKVNMRATPSFSPTSGANLQVMASTGSGLNLTGCDIGYGSNTFVDLFPTVVSGLVAGNASVFRSAGTTSGFISFSAEL